MNDYACRGSGPRLPWPRRVRVAAVVTVMAAALLTAACSSSPSSTGSGSSPGAGGSTSSQSTALAFARCVRSHGVPSFPDPDSSGHFSKVAVAHLPVSASQLQSAEAPCQNLLPNGPSEQVSVTAQEQQDYLRAAACMRSHGFTNFPDPVFSGGIVTFSIPSTIDTNSTQFTQAKHTCEQLIPAGLPDSGRSGG